MPTPPQKKKAPASEAEAIPSLASVPANAAPSASSSSPAPYPGGSMFSNSPPALLSDADMMTPVISTLAPDAEQSPPSSSWSRGAAQAPQALPSTPIFGSGQAGQGGWQAGQAGQPSAPTQPVQAFDLKGLGDAFSPQASTANKGKTTSMPNQGKGSLRLNRAPVELKINDNLVTVTKNWLKSKPNQAYRVAVKQALMVACTQVQLDDFKGKEFLAEVGPVRKRLQNLMAGLEPVTVPPKLVEKRSPLLAVQTNATQGGPGSPTGMPPPGKRHMLVKYGARFKFRKVRPFIIHAGQLVVYKSEEPNAPPRHYYGLAAAEFVIEQKTEAKQIPPFEVGYSWRIRLACRERQTGPMLLYAEDEKQVSLWVRVMKLAKYTTSQSEKMALQMCFRKLLSTSRQKGWDALAKYVQDLFNTKQLIWQLAMRLIRADHSRAWIKCKAVYQKYCEADKLKREKQKWAAQFLMNQLRSIAKAQMRPVEEVRHSIVTKVQHEFRRFKNAQLQENAYALGPLSKTRVQQAKHGTPFGISYRALSADEVLQLSLEEPALNTKREYPQAFNMQKTTYTETSMPIARVSHVHASQCLSMLLFSDEAANTSDFAGLSKANWLQFVHLSRISAVVLNSERAEGASSRPEMLRIQEGLRKMEELQGSSGALTSRGEEDLLNGYWITLLGPRVCWGRQWQRPGPTEVNQAPSVVGSADGLALADALMQGNRSSWLRIFSSVKSATLPNVIVAGAAPEPNATPKQTRCVVNLLGRRFASVPRTGDEVDYSLNFELVVPVLEDKSSLAALDDSELCLDIVREDTLGGKQQVIWQARVKLWRLLAPGNVIQGPNAARFPIGKALSDGKVQAGRRLPLVQPGSREPEDGNTSAFVNMDVMAEVLAAGAVANPCMSPELLGAGPVSALYSSNRGVWYDPQLGPGKFQADHVANFIEFVLGTLRFPAGDVADTAKLYSYYVEVRCVGASAVSPSLYRPLPAWSSVFAMDPGQIAFRGAKIILSLPPGFWSNSMRPPQVELAVFRREQSEQVAFPSFLDLDSMNGKPGSQPRPLERVFHASLRLDGLLLNHQRSGIPILVGSTNRPPTVVNLDKGDATGGTVNDSAVLGVEITLRDRDYVWAGSGESCTGEPPCPLCVGDRAMVNMEEVMVYPSSNADLKRLLSPAVWEPKEAGKPWAMPLRDPYMTHELEQSGLRGLPEFEHFRVKSIPRSYSNVTPTKFILPPCERTFQQQHLPGVFRRILYDLCRNGGAKATPSGRLVPRLTHLARQVPCVLLAVHADQTCDLELAQHFLAAWEKSPSQRYAIPGVIQVLPSVPRGEAEATKRIVLYGVPVAAVAPAHAAGFNLYDAALADVKEAVAVDPASRSRIFDGQRMPAPGLRCGSFACVAGPLPADANPAVCAYEWSLSVCAPSEEDAYHFVDLLRQVVRLDHQQHARQLFAARKDAEKKAADLAAANAITSPQLALANVPRQPGWQAGDGQLEVVLVEARRLQSKRMTKNGADSLDAYLVGASPAKELTTLLSESQELNPSVNFRILSSAEGEPILCKGVKVQTSPAMYGTDSPDWSKADGLASSGGWTFRSSLFNPEKCPDLVLELEVLHRGIAIETQIGAIQLPVVKNKFLTDPNAPFRDLWLPLTSPAADGARTLNPSGEIHIMTFWNGTGDGSAVKGPASARAYMSAEVGKKLAGGCVREPIHGLQVPLAGYNPNSTRDSTWPRRRSEEMAVRIEGLLRSAPYVECCEQRQFQAWISFRRQWKESGYQQASLGEMRLVWLQQVENSGSQVAAELEALLTQGVPSSIRAWVWPQITLSSRVQGRYGADAYQNILAASGRIDTPAFAQLGEDMLRIAEWEPSLMPSVMKKHSSRLEAARNVCSALITFSLDRAKGQGPGVLTNLPSYRDEREGSRCTGTAVTYCESVLILAFYLLLPQSARAEDDPGSRQKCLPESTVFWLLFTLIGTRTNGAYKDYYATSGPIGAEVPTESPNRAICSKSGAMEDVFLLQCTLVVHEAELWVRMGALGFQLVSIFYGAFMCLYARMLPTASLFRLWDLLFAESSNPKAFPHARHGLVDLAFGVLRSARAELLQCQSALEVRDHIDSVLASLNDPQSVVELMTDASAVLWGGFSRKQVLKLWRDGTREFDRYHAQFEQQNELLKQLAHVMQVEPEQKLQPGLQSPMPSLHGTPMTPAKSMTSALSNAMSGQKSGAMQSSELALMTVTGGAEAGVSAKTLASTTIPLFLRLFPPTSNSFPTAGLLRPVPMSLLDFGPPLEESGVDRVLRLVGASSTAGISAVAAKQEADESGAEPLPRNQAMPCPPGSRPEPAEISDVAWVNEIGQNLPGWRQFTKPVYDTFVDKTEGRISLNEFLIALICCCKGTAGEKAGALFDLFSGPKSSLLPSTSHLWQHPQHHRIPISQSVVQRVSSNPVNSAAQTSPPANDCRKDAALHFQVWANNTVGKPALLGETVVTNVGPFTAGADQDVQSMWFSIWGAPDKSKQSYFDAGRPNSMKVCLGEMDMAVKWIPDRGASAEVGQLCVRLRAIRFFTQFVSSPASMHPSVTVVTYSAKLEERRIPCQKSTMSAMASAPSSDVIEFRAPSLLSKSFNSTALGDCGWNQASQEWRWNKTLGDQRSFPGFVLPKEKVLEIGATAQPVIDMWAVRIIVQGVLARSLQYMTNRQAILLADACFNRAGAVPGILDALLVPGENVGEYSSAAALKEDFRNSGKEVLDVRHQLLLEAERQLYQTMGGLNLWPAALTGSSSSLKALKINDPFAGQKKLIWMRFARAGNGARERCTIPFDENGEMLSQVEVRLDADGADGSMDSFARCHPESTLTKEEFVSCCLACPAMAEPLRRKTAADHVAIQPRPLLFDVTLPGNPLSDEMDLKDMFLHVKIGVLLEIWTHSSIPGVYDTFLGEAWLPPLETLGPVPRQHVLSLERVADAGPTGSRPNGRQEQRDQSGAIAGKIAVEASWHILGGSEEGEEEGATESQIALAQQGMLRGRLVLTLLRGDELVAKSWGTHMPGVSQFEMPLYMVGYAWNEARSNWEMQAASSTGIMSAKERQLFKSNQVSMKVVLTPPDGVRKGSATWHEQHQIVLGGAPEGWRPGEVAPSGQPMVAERVLSKQVKVCFGNVAEWDRMVSAPTQGGKASMSSEQARMGSSPEDQAWAHQVEAYASDTIGDFLRKLAIAVGQLANRQPRRTDEDMRKAMAVYKEFGSKGTQQVLMVYAPTSDPSKLRRPWNFEEYKKVCVEAMADLHHWEPLDPACTFEQYASKFGFGGLPNTFPPLLRVEEAGEILRATSHRYRRFQQEKAAVTSIENCNTDSQAFAYARFLHASDANSVEWRPCVARAETGGKRSYRVSWAFTPSCSSGAGGMQEQSLDEGSVLLAPNEPEMIDASVPEHQELLAEAQDLRAKGKSDYEIGIFLNAKLDQLIQSQSMTQSFTRRPPPITASIVRSHLQRLEARQLSEAMGARK